MKNYKWIPLKDNANRHTSILSNVTIIDCRNMKLSIFEKIKYGVIK
jgi:hypothetical protein